MTNSISQLSTSLQNAYTMFVFGLLIIPNVDIALELWILRILAFVITVYHLHYVTCTSSLHSITQICINTRHLPCA
uniref:Uncharacterized protein n=1 Tax=Romanomermis culicivorax TaxID=13658 RepID=A0A915JE28_ROMCU